MGVYVCGSMFPRRLFEMRKRKEKLLRNVSVLKQNNSQQFLSVHEVEQRSQ